MNPLSKRRFATRMVTSQRLLSLLIAVGSAGVPLAGAEAQDGKHHAHHEHGVEAPNNRGADAHAHHGGRGKRSSDAPAVSEFKAAHERMMQAMDLPYTGDPDVDFRVHMIPHHAGAMDMAKIAMRRAKDPWTRQLAESVIYEQQREITEMQGWLAGHGVPAPQSGQPYHVLSTEFVRGEAATPGTRGELAGRSWAPGLGIPATR